MPGRTVILSDTHFGGSKAPAPASLRPLWAGATQLVINGDVGELHHPVFRGAAARAILELIDLCAADGVRLTMLSGNHDAYLSDHRHLLLADGRVLVMHGDALDPSVAPWSRAASRMQRSCDRAIDALTPSERRQLEPILAVSQHAAHAEWEDPAEVYPTTLRTLMLRPWKALAVLWFWSTMAARANHFAELLAPRARFVILGHSHRAGVWQVGRRVVVNTGSFGMPGRPRAVILEDRRLAVVRVRRQGRSWRYAGRLAASFPLPSLEGAGEELPSRTSTRTGEPRRDGRAAA